jgi:hypothetical protein
MNFKQYLQVRHKTKGGKVLSEISAKQYNSRLNSMIRKNIYDGKSLLNEEITKKINQKYANKTGEYERTIKYYLEYKSINNIEIMN